MRTGIHQRIRVFGIKKHDAGEIAARNKHECDELRSSDCRPTSQREGMVVVVLNRITKRTRESDGSPFLVHLRPFRTDTAAEKTGVNRLLLT